MAVIVSLYIAWLVYILLPISSREWLTQAMLDRYVSAIISLDDISYRY
jgi:hypothetical protein